MNKINWEKEKENLERLINQEHLAFSRIAEIYGYKNRRFIKQKAIKLGIKIEERKMGEVHEHPEISYHCQYCGKEFKNRYKYCGHVTHCLKNPKLLDNLEHLNNARKHIKHVLNEEKEILHCQYCGKEVHNRGCLAIHEKSCVHNPNHVKNTNRKGNGGAAAGHSAWNKGKTMFNDERVLKMATTRKKHIEDGSVIVKSHKHTEKSKQILREKMINFIKNNGNGEFGQHFSKKGCKFIDELNKKYNWNLQHALNGGEKQVCGYFLDGYDEKLNIAFEYDEQSHYKDVYRNVLCDRDIIRQNIIINELHCTFYRYNEVLDKLYIV